MNTDAPNRLAENVAALLKLRDMSENALAKATGIPQPTINRIVKGESREPRQSNIEAIAAHFGLQPSELLKSSPEDAVKLATLQRRVAEPIRAYEVDAVEDGAPVPDTHAGIEHMDFEISAGAGSEVPVFAETKYPMLYRIDWFHRHRARPENVKSMGVRGSSMERTLFNGDRIAVNLADKAVINDHVFALLLDGQAVVKRLFRHGPGGLRIVSDNPDKALYPDILLDADDVAERVCILGRVIDKSGIGGL